MLSSLLYKYYAFDEFPLITNEFSRPNYFILSRVHCLLKVKIHGINEHARETVLSYGLQIFKGIKDKYFVLVIW